MAKVLSYTIISKVPHTSATSSPLFAATTSDMADNTGAPYSRSSSYSRDRRESSNVSLSVNYLPSKFSSTLVAPGARKRKGGGGKEGMGMKRGGGVEAFRSGEARVAGENDEDYDGVEFAPGRVGRKRLKWNKFKWVLFVSNLLVGGFSECIGDVVTDTMCCLS